MTDRATIDTIAQIARRAQKMGLARKHLDCMMDIETVHESIGLKLEELLDADDGNFAHDIGGINRHLNRTTGKLEDCFDPRYSA